MTRLRSDRTSVAMRREMLCNTLAEHPWSTPRMLMRFIMDETGGRPALLTGALYVPAETVYADLRALEREGRVQRRMFSARRTLWAVTND